MRYTLISYICIIKELDYCMIKAFKYRLNPTKEQISQMDKTFGCCRYVYNWALDMRIKAYQGDKKSLTSVDLCKLLTMLKKRDDTQWLNEVSNDRYLLAARNIRRFGLERQNLVSQENINKEPVVNRGSGVESGSMGRAVKRQVIPV